MDEPSQRRERSSSYEHDSPREDNGEPHPKKRRLRLGSSCQVCRRRKMRCDRTKPCSRCVKSGCEDQCIYDVEAFIAVNGGSSGAQMLKRVGGAGGRGDTDDERGIYEVIQDPGVNRLLGPNRDGSLNSGRVTAEASGSLDAASTPGGSWWARTPDAARWRKDGRPASERVNGRDGNANEVARNGVQQRTPILQQAYHAPAHVAGSQTRNTDQHSRQQGLRLWNDLHSIDATSRGEEHEKQLKDLRERVADLEAQTRLTNKGMLNYKPTTENNDTFLTKGRDENRQELSIFRGKNWRTQFTGASAPGTLLTIFPGLMQLMKSVFERDDEIQSLKAEINSKKPRPTPQPPSTPLSVSKPIPDLNHLLRLLPNREICDKFVNIYLSTFETAFRVLHVPSFRKSYDDIWQYPGNSTASHIVLILLVISCVYCIEQEKPLPTFVGKSSSRRSAVVEWLDACEAWLSSHSMKHLNLRFWQARVLLVLSKHVNRIKIKRTWMHTGELLRFAMSSGMHREPTYFKEMSVFDAEMKRRLWATIVELDLLATMQRGLPPTLKDGDWDVRPPLNVDDDELETDMAKPPEPSPFRPWTDTSYLSLSQITLKLRLTLIQGLNGLSTGFAREKVKQLEDQIYDAINLISSTWSTPNPRNSKSNRPTFAVLLLILELKHYILLIHAQTGLFETIPEAKPLSRSVCLITACQILDHMKEATEQDATALLFLREDAFTAGLTLTLEMFYSRIAGEHSIYYPATPELLRILPQKVDDALEFCEIKCVRLGSHLQNFIALAFALARAQSVGVADKEKKQFEETAIRRVRVRVKEMFALQSPQARFDSAESVSSREHNTDNRLAPVLGDPNNPMDFDFSFDDWGLFGFDMEDVWNVQ